MILLIIITIVIIIYLHQKNKIETFVVVEEKEIPKLLFETYHTKDKIPEKVAQNRKKYASEYKRIILDDDEGLIFIKKHFPEDVSETFTKLKLGAHKADLLRYCLLYIYGGVYMDIKTVLLKPLNEIFVDKNVLYTALSINEGTIYQGIIASPKHNPLFLELIQHIVDQKDKDIDYLAFTKDFYDRIMNKTNVKLFKEQCSKKSEDCSGKLDRYGLCCYIYDNNNKKIFKVRYSDYPW